MGQGKLMRNMASKVPSTKGGGVEAKGSPGVKMGFGGLIKGLARTPVSGLMKRGTLAGSKGFAGEQQGKRRIGRGGLFGGAAMRMAGSVGQKKEECD